MGKSALNTFFLKQTLLNDGDILLKKLNEKLDEQSRELSRPFARPDNPPLFSDFKVNIKVGYEKYFEPYFVNGFYLGLPNEQLNVMHVPPFSKIFLGEAQRYYDSRKSSRFPGFISRFFEMHRHYGIDIFLDVQRPNLIDLNIKALCRRFIEVREMQNLRDDSGQIVKSIFDCRQFDSWTACEKYIAGDQEGYSTVTFINEGNIFDCYDSHTYFKEFLPQQGKDFDYLKYGSNSAFNNFNEPPEYRAKKEQR